jgi:hypothetical protein
MASCNLATDLSLIQKDGSVEDARPVYGIRTCQTPGRQSSVSLSRPAGLTGKAIVGLAGNEPEVGVTSRLVRHEAAFASSTLPAVVTTAWLRGSAPCSADSVLGFRLKS